MITLYVNTITKRLLNALGGDEIGVPEFFLKDINQVGIVFDDGDGNNITAALLAGGQLLNAGIKARVDDTTLLASISSYILVSGVATAILNLNTTELVNYFLNSTPSTANRVWMHFEVQVCDPDDRYRDTYFQGGFPMRGVVQDVADESSSGVVLPSIPQWLVVRMDFTARTGGTGVCLDGLATVGLALPFAALIRPGSTTGELWCLDTWDGVTVPDGTYVVNPVDFNAVTNRRQWTRIL